MKYMKKLAITAILGLLVFGVQLAAPSGSWVQQFSLVPPAYACGGCQSKADTKKQEHAEKKHAPHGGHKHGHGPKHGPKHHDPKTAPESERKTETSPAPQREGRDWGQCQFGQSERVVSRALRGRLAVGDIVTLQRGSGTIIASGYGKHAVTKLKTGRACLTRVPRVTKRPVPTIAPPVDKGDIVWEREVVPGGPVQSQATRTVTTQRATSRSQTGNKTVARRPNFNIIPGCPSCSASGH